MVDDTTHKKELGILIHTEKDMGKAGGPMDKMVTNRESLQRGTHVSGNVNIKSIKRLIMELDNNNYE